MWMNLVVEIAALLWITGSVFLSLWTWHDAWYLAHSRLWSAAALLFGPFGFLLYIYRSRWFVYSAQSGVMIPSYDINLRRRTQSRRAGNEPGETAHVGTPAASAAPSWTEDRAELPRCPVCRTAVSFYDVKCIRCGHSIGGMGQSTA